MTTFPIRVGLVDRRAVAAFFAERAAGVDSAALDVRDGLHWLAQRGLLDLDLQAAGELIALVAEQCMASAFALWCQRMVIEYVGAAVEPDFPVEQLLPRLASAELLGSTALGNGMAHLVLGFPLTVRLEHDGDAIVLDGSIAWASNLLAEPDAALTVVAAEDADGQSYVVAVPLDSPGLVVAPYPRLLALQATRSSSVRLERVRLPASSVMSGLASCLPRVRPVLLVLQSCFCEGLARAALDAAEAQIVHGLNSHFQAELEGWQDELGSLERQLRAQLRQPDAQRIPKREFVETRLHAARLATAASRFEVKLRGGRAYRLEDPANRRFREAAFLAIQAPTEAQLEWELARGR